MQKAIQKCCSTSPSCRNFSELWILIHFRHSLWRHWKCYSDSHKNFKQHL